MHTALAVIIPKADKYVCVVGETVIGSSKHFDYFEHHYKLRDLHSVAAFQLTKFVHVAEAGEVISVLSADNLLKFGRRKAALPADSLSVDEQDEVLTALNTLKPKVESPLLALLGNINGGLPDLEHVKLPRGRPKKEPEVPTGQIEPNLFRHVLPDHIVPIKGLPITPVFRARMIREHKLALEEGISVQRSIEELARKYRLKYEQAYRLVVA